MKKFVSILYFVAMIFELQAQIVVSGRVVSTKGEALPAVNISIKGSYDGTITDFDGTFEFEVESIDEAILAASCIGYKTEFLKLDKGKTQGLNIVLKESVTSLNSVTITAGSFAADDKQRASVLEPLDIYTTAGSLGDIGGALKTLPGTQPASDDGRLLVRGGEAYETSVYVDGLLAAKPFYSKVPDLPSRGRFAPSLFSGTVFNTGGYSAEYGQALSSVLTLESNTVEVEEETGISLMSIGTELSRTWCAKNRSTTVGLGYNNMAPYYTIANNILDWTKPTESGSFNFIHRQKNDNGAMLKIFTTGEYGSRSFNTAWGDEVAKIENDNGNIYTNINYTAPLGEQTVIKSGLAVTFDKDHQLAYVHDTKENEGNVEARVSLKHQLCEGVELNAGLSDSYTSYTEDYKQVGAQTKWDGGVNDHIVGAFAESEIKLSANMALRPGLRYEYSSYLHQSSVSPRLAAAYKTGNNSQLSIAYGYYYQNPVNDYLKFGNDFEFEKAVHYIASFQTGRLSERLFRAEAYYKGYDNLVVYERGSHPYDMSFNQSGFGYSKGIDLFYSDRKSIKNANFWLSYSYIDTKRQYQDYPSEVTPDFVAKHTFSAVGKYFVGAINSLVGFSWNLASGRPYNLPGDIDFMSRKAPYYNDLSVNLSYLTHIFNQYTIIHFSFSNVLGRDHLVGYRTIHNYSGGEDTVMPLIPDVKQFLFLGVFITID